MKPEKIESYLKLKQYLRRTEEAIMLVRHEGKQRSAGKQYEATFMVGSIPDDCQLLNQRLDQYQKELELERRSEQEN